MANNPIPPLQLQSLLNSAPKEFHSAIKQLYNDTYKYGFKDGKQAQQEICQCSLDDEDE